MRLLDNTHMFMIVGEKVHITRGANALSDACDKVARLRLRGGRWTIMEPRFCEHGCCVLTRPLDYTDKKFAAMTCHSKGKRLV